MDDLMPPGPVSWRRGPLLSEEDEFVVAQMSLLGPAAEPLRASNMLSWEADFQRGLIHLLDDLKRQHGVQDPLVLPFQTVDSLVLEEEEAVLVGQGAVGLQQRTTPALLVGQLAGYPMTIQR